MLIGKLYFVEINLLAQSIYQILKSPDSFEILKMKISSAADVTITYHRGLVRITVPLPSRKEKCMFTLKPITHTIGDFIGMLKGEDRGIDRVAVTTVGEFLKNFFKTQHCEFSPEIFDAN